MAVEIFGYRISDRGLLADVVDVFNETAGNAGKNCRYMACANPHSLVVASRDEQFRVALQEADILIPDGSGIVLAAKILEKRILSKVAGFDFFYETCLEAERRGGIRFFFLGSSEQVLDLIARKLKNEFPHIEVCGVYSPPYKNEFSDAENRMMVETVNLAQPDILWVGMTAPKQEKWLLANRAELNVPFAAAIGAVFDFYAGTKQRSSEFWIRLGLEWLPRFLKEPRRLWERNLKSTPVFLWWVLREKIRRLTIGR